MTISLRPTLTFFRLVLAALALSGASGAMAANQPHTAPAEPKTGSPELPMVRVTAGDFGATSRIAFNFHPDNGFRVERTDRQLTVQFPGAQVRFAYEPVYPGRQATRVVFAGPEERADGTAFVLRFACNCEADVTLDQSRRVVVQIREKGSPPAPQPTGSGEGGAHSAPAPDVPAAGSAMAAPDPTPDPSHAEDALPATATTGHVPRPRPKDRRPADGAPLTQTAAAAPDQSVPPPSGVLAAHEVDRLRQSLEWAAQHGFLDKPGDVDLSDAPTPEKPPPANIANLPASPPSNAAEKPMAQPSPGHMSRAAAVHLPPPADLVAAQDGPEATTLPLANVNWTCSGPAEPPLVDWSEAGRRNGNFLSAVSSQHAAVATLPPAQAMRRMTLFYLAHGLTREALVSLDSTGEPEPALREAISILLGRGDEVGPALLAASPCQSDMAIWRAALLKAHGYRKLAEWAAADAAEPLATFPPFARTVLALELAEAAVNRGNVALADTFLAQVQPAASQDVAAQVALLQGRKALAQGQTERANWYFSQALDGDPGVRRQTRIALIQDAVDNERPLPTWAKDVTQSALFDYRGDRRLLPLALLAATVASASGDYARALDTLDAAGRRLPDAVNRASLTAKAKDLLATALAAASTDNADALQLFIDYHTYIGGDAAGQSLSAQVARQMLDAGLPSTALRILEPLAQSPDAGPDRRLMLAEAHLRAGDPEAALATLDALGKDAALPAETSALRRQALASLRRYEAAAQVPEAGLTDMPATADLLWAAGDWSASASAFRKVLTDTPADTPAATAGPLALRALAAAYMAGGQDRLGDQAGKAVALAQAAGLADAAAALTAPPLAGNLTLPDSIAAVLKRSRQVSRIFPPQADPNRSAPPQLTPSPAKGS